MDIEMTPNMPDVNWHGHFPPNLDWFPAWLKPILFDFKRIMFDLRNTLYWIIDSLRNLDGQEDIQKACIGIYRG